MVTFSIETFCLLDSLSEPVEETVVSLSLLLPVLEEFELLKRKNGREMKREEGEG